MIYCAFERFWSSPAGDTIIACAFIIVCLFVVYAIAIEWKASKAADD